MAEPRITRVGIREDRPYYNQDQPRWWQSERQRIVILDFETPEDAQLWDAASTELAWEQLRLFP
jgi:hypothetical protein